MNVRASPANCTTHYSRVFMEHLCCYTMLLKECLRIRPNGIRLPTRCAWFVAFLTKVEPSCRGSAHQGSSRLSGEESSSWPFAWPTSTLRCDPHRQQIRGPGGG